MKSRKNPYAAKLKKSVTMRLSEDVIGYFKQMADEKSVPYQSLTLREAQASAPVRSGRPPRGCAKARSPLATR